MITCRQLNNTWSNEQPERVMKPTSTEMEIELYPGGEKLQIVGHVAPITMDTKDDLGQILYYLVIGWP